VTSVLLTHGDSRVEMDALTVTAVSQPTALNATRSQVGKQPLYLILLPCSNIPIL